MQVFGTLGLLMVLLGSSWLLLGRSGSKMIPKMAPKIGQKVVKKMVEKTTPKKVNLKLILGPKTDPRMA